METIKAKQIMVDLTCPGAETFVDLIRKHDSKAIVASKKSKNAVWISVLGTNKRKRKTLKVRPLILGEGGSESCRQSYAITLK